MDDSVTIDVRMYRMSGIGRYLQNVMPGLIPRLNAQKIRLLGDPADIANESWAGDPRIELREFRAGIFSIAEQMAGMSRSHGDLLWVPHFNVPMLFRGKLLVTIHDVCLLAHPETLPNELHRWYARRLLKSAASRAAAILCDSEFTASEVQKFLGVDRSHIVVAYPCVREPSNASTYPQPEVGDLPYLLAVGNIKKHKNLGPLIAAFERIKDQIPHSLIVVGKKEGFLNPDSQFSGASELMDGRVRFTGHVSDQELEGYYEHAEALIFPSLYEGFGYPLVEAMAKGCPVACSNASCLPEIAGDAALLFDPSSIDDIANAIMTIVGDGNLRAFLKERGLVRARHFERGASVEKTAFVINQLLANSSITSHRKSG